MKYTHDSAAAKVMTADQSAIITSSDIVDALIAIRDELAAGMKAAFIIPKVWELVGRIERDADLATEQKMDQLMRDLAGSLPPVRGGGFDDHEDICPEFLADPHGWPAGYDVDLDGYTWEPTPVEVLTAEYDAHTDTHDWDAYFALGLGITEEDHAVACGMV